MRRQRRRRTWRDYEAIKNNWNPEKFGLNPDGTPRQSYAPVMPQNPYASRYEEPVWGPSEDRYEPYDGN